MENNKSLPASKLWGAFVDVFAFGSAGCAKRCLSLLGYSDLPRLFVGQVIS